MKLNFVEKLFVAYFSARIQRSSG